MSRRIIAVLLLASLMAFAGPGTSPVPTGTCFEDNFERQTIGPYWRAGYIPGGGSFPEWGIDSTSSHSPTRSASDSPNGIQYPPSSQRYMVMTTGIDLRGMISAQFSFWTKFTTQQSADICYVQISVDNLNWQTLRTYSGTSGWRQEIVDVSDYVGYSDVRLRFLLDSDNGNNKDGWYVDDVVVSREAAPVYDVATSEIIAPLGFLEARARVHPAATFANLGNQTASCRVHFRITRGPNVMFRDSGTIQLALGQCTTVVFSEYEAYPSGTYYTRAWTTLSNDANRANDSAFGSFEVMEGRRDVGVMRIIAPSGSYFPGPLVPRAWFGNFGTEPEEFEARCRIVSPDSTVHSVKESLFVNPGDSVEIAFRDWDAMPGTYMAFFQTSCATDTILINNNLSTAFIVMRPEHDVGVALIIRPVDSCYAGSIQPQVTVRNYGSSTENFFTRLLVLDTLGLIVYDHPVSVTNLPSDGILTVSFPNWDAMPGLYRVRCFTELETDELRKNDTVKADVTVRGSGSTVGLWASLALVPPGPKGKRVKDGGGLAFMVVEEAPDSIVPYVYMLKGGNRLEYYRYSIPGGAWQTQDSIPAVGSSGKKKGVKKGAAMAAANGKIYAAKGNKITEFWEFAPAAPDGQRWNQRAGIPGASKLKEGASMVTVDVSGRTYLYFLKGSKTHEFYRYDVDADLWEVMATAPAGASNTPYKSGSCLGYDGVNTIYALKGVYAEFYAYHVDQNAWTTLEGMPMISRTGGKKKVKDGAAMAWMEGKLYAQKGGNTREFWSYLADSNKWLEVEEFPSGAGKRVKGGGSLIAGPDRLYALKGNNTLEFYSYIPGRQACGDAAQPTANAAGVPVRTEQRRLSVSPNPFVGQTSVCYVLPRSGIHSVKLYDLTGQLLRVLAAGHASAGTHRLDLRVGEGRDLARGIYLLRLEGPEMSATEKLILE